MKIFGKKKTALLTALFISVGILAGCGAKAKEKEHVMIYTSIYPDIIELMKPVLEKKFPDITVEWFQGGTESVVTKITGEIEAKSIEADLLMVADPSYYLTLQKQDLLAKHDFAERSKTTMKDAEGYWTGVRISNMIIAYNSNLVTEADAPKSFEDLLDPKWQGKIAMPSPLLSGTAFVAAGALSEKYGWEYFEKLKANGVVVEKGNSAVQSKLLTGEYAVAMILEENILKLADAGEPVKVVYPTDGTIVIPSPIAMFKASKNQDASKKIMEWFLTTEGQELVVKGWMHSVREDVTSPKGADALSSFIGTKMETDWNLFSTDSETIKSTFSKKVLE